MSDSETTQQLADNHNITLDQLIEATLSTSLIDRATELVPAGLLDIFTKATEDRQALIARKVDFIKKYKLTKKPSFIEANFNIEDILEDSLKVATPILSQQIQMAKLKTSYNGYECSVCHARDGKLTPACMSYLRRY